MNILTTTVCTAAAVVALTSLTGCKEKAPAASSADTAEPAGDPTHSYTVRGKVVMLPSAERPMDDLQIRHEAIPDYKNRDGVVFENAGVRGMKSMTMPFPVDESVSLENIAVGDIIEFTFVTVWGESYPAYKVTKVTKLADDTELDFGN